MFSIRIFQKKLTYCSKETLIPSPKHYKRLLQGNKRENVIVCNEEIVSDGHKERKQNFMTHAMMSKVLKIT